jgi:sialate O-acetylesterase
MKKYIKAPLIILSFFTMVVADAKVKLPSVFSDNMVLQQKTSAAIWGTATAGKAVTISTSWNTKKYTAVADKSGKWKAKVLTPSFGGPYTVNISDGDLTTLKNVMIGEVWVCSGQSNMEMPLAGWGKIQNYEKEIAAANYPNIRLLQAEHVTSDKPLDDAKVSNGGWTPCTPQYVAEFSSVAYFFAREIYQKIKIPIGLIHTSWGGTIAEAWTSGSTLKTLPDFAEATRLIENAATQAGRQSYEQQMQVWQKSTFDKDAGTSGGNFCIRRFMEDNRFARCVGNCTSSGF